MIAFDASDRSLVYRSLVYRSSAYRAYANRVYAFVSTSRNYSRSHSLPHHCFTRIDQAFLLWGVLTLVIFSLGQFSLLSWSLQAVIDAALTGVGIALTSRLTWAIACQAKLRWVVLLWAVLMSVGTIATTYGIFYSSGLILSHLCVLWLALCVAGYGAMAIGMRSRCFTAACLVHLGALATPFYESITGLSHTSGWQFFYSGLVIASTLFFFSFVPWDRQPSDAKSVQVQ